MWEEIYMFESVPQGDAILMMVSVFFSYRQMLVISLLIFVSKFKHSFNK